MNAISIIEDTDTLGTTLRVEPSGPGVVMVSILRRRGGLHQARTVAVVPLAALKAAVDRLPQPAEQGV